jgi:hypothetical protein
LPECVGVVPIELLGETPLGDFLFAVVRPHKVDGGVGKWLAFIWLG